MKSPILVCAALLAATPVLFAQEEKNAAPAEMPSPKQKQHELLKSLAGSWDVVMKSEAMPGVPGMEEATENEGTERAELICDGLWLKSITKASWQGKPFEGLWMHGYDPAKDRYVGVWVSSDDEECGACTMEGEYDAAKKSWTWTGMTPHGPMRSVFAVKDADTTVETCYMQTPEGKEAKCMEITRRRAKAPVPMDAAADKPEGLSKEHEMLLEDVGDWTATVKMDAPGMGETKGSESVMPICNGRWTWSEFHGEMMGMPFVGHSLTGYDPTKKEYVSFWVDSMSPGLTKTTGTYDEDARAYTMTGESVDQMGNPMAIDQRIVRKDEDTRVLKMKFGEGAQANTMEIVYERKAKK